MHLIINWGGIGFEMDRCVDDRNGSDPNLENLGSTFSHNVKPVTSPTVMMRGGGAKAKFIFFATLD